MATEIKVNKNALAKSEKALSDLGTAVANRKLTTKLTSSKGALATEINAAGEQLTLIGDALFTLISKTKIAVENTRVKFEETDITIAHHFGIKE
jgi:hypothetical protein